MVTDTVVFRALEVESYVLESLELSVWDGEIELVSLVVPPASQHDGVITPFTTRMVFTLPIILRDSPTVSICPPQPYTWELKDEVLRARSPSRHGGS